MTQRAYVLIAVYLFAMGFLLLPFGSEWLRLGRFAKLGVETRGTVVKTTCGQHESFSYSYRVGDRTYRGGGHGGMGNPECRDLRPGDPVRIWYLPNNEMASIAGDPAGWKRNEELTLAVAPFWFGIFFAFAIWRELRAKPKTKTSE